MADRQKLVEETWSGLDHRRSVGPDGCLRRRRDHPRFGSGDGTNELDFNRTERK